MRISVISSTHEPVVQCSTLGTWLPHCFNDDYGITKLRYDKRNIPSLFYGTSSKMGN